MTESNWHGWQDDNGDAMFVADGPKHPVLVRVTQNGAEEHVLATFSSPDAAEEFQAWLDRSFEDTALANQHLSMAYHGGAPLLRARGPERGGMPGLVDE